MVIYTSPVIKSYSNILKVYKLGSVSYKNVLTVSPVLQDTEYSLDLRMCVFVLAELKLLVTIQ